MRLLASCFAAILLAGFASVRAATAASPELPDGLYAEFTTPRGVVVAELFFREAPLTVASFVGLAEGTLGPKPGQPYFNGLKFHRVVPDFVVQGGDPLGTGEGGPGYEFPDEFTPGLRHDAAGILSMANAGPDTNGSQFFFTLREVNRLNYLHSVFGRTVRGLEVLAQIQQGDTMNVRILRIGRAARAFATDQKAFDRLLAKARPSAAPAFDDPEGILPVNPPRARAFNAKLGNFTRFTGIRLYARLFSKPDAGEPDARPEAIAARLARKYGAATDGALAVYFAETDQWVFHVSEPLRKRFYGSATDPAKVEADFVAAARQRAAVIIANAEKTAPVDAGQKTKLLVDEVLDALIFKLESKP